MTAILLLCAIVAVFAFGSKLPTLATRVRLWYRNCPACRLEARQGSAVLEAHNHPASHWTDGRKRFLFGRTDPRKSHDGVVIKPRPKANLDAPLKQAN